MTFLNTKDHNNILVVILLRFPQRANFYMLMSKIPSQQFLKILKINNIQLSVFAYKAKVNIATLNKLKSCNRDTPKYLLLKLYTLFETQLNRESKQLLVAQA